MKKLFVLAALVLLASCQDAPATYKPLTFNFSGKPQILVNVAEIKVIDNFQPSLAAPYVEHEFPTPPAGAVKQWANQRLRAIGDKGVLEITIDDASAKEIPLKTTKGVKGLFSNQQAARYDASIKATMKLYNGIDAISVASGDVMVSRSKTIDERATVDDHLRLYDTMTRDMMVTFDDAASQRLRQYFAAYIK